MKLVYECEKELFFCLLIMSLCKLSLMFTEESEKIFLVFYFACSLRHTVVYRRFITRKKMMKSIFVSGSIDITTTANTRQRFFSFIIDSNGNFSIYIFQNKALPILSLLSEIIFKSSLCSLSLFPH